MPQESNDLIIGATISLLSALLTFILSSAFHWMRENRARDWIIEDRKYNRRLEVLSLRLKEVEKFINQYFDIAEKLSNYELALVVTKKIDVPNSFLNDINPLLAKTTRSHSSIMNLEDEELNKLSMELIDNIRAEFKIIYSLEEKVKNVKLVDEEIEEKRINAFYAKVVTIRKSMIKRIDHLLGFQN